MKNGVDVTIVLLPVGDDAGLAQSASDALAQRDVTTEVLHPQSGAPAALCTASVQAAQGRWIAFLEAGDRWHSDRLRSMLDIADAQRRAWVYGARVLLGGPAHVVGLALAADPVSVIDGLRGGNVVGGPSSVLCRRELLQRAEPFDARLRALIFWRAWLALSELETPAACPEPLSAERLDRSELLRSPRRSLIELRLLNREGVVRGDVASHERHHASELLHYGRRRPAAATLLVSAVEHRRPRDLLRAAAAPWSARVRVDSYAPPAWLDHRPSPAKRARSWAPEPGRCEVSVVIPTRNRPRFLRQAVDSALAQLDVDLEVIVVDDASDLPEARMALQFEDRRVRTRVRVCPGGAGRARNEALLHARGEWIAFLDDDDLFAPQRLRAHLDATGAAGFGFCGQILVDPRRRAVGTLPAPPAGQLAERLRKGSSIGGPSAVIARTELLREVGGYDEEFYALGDWDLWMRLAAHATAVATPDLLVAYTVHPSNMHLRAPERVLADFTRFARVHDVGPRAETELLEWLAEELEGAGRGHAAARLHLRLARRHRRIGSIVRALQALRHGSAPAPDPSPFLSPEWLRKYGAADAE